MSHIQRHYENYAFDHEQYEVVEAAMERAFALARAMSSSGYTPSRSAALAWICVDFLASNDFGLPKSEEVRARYLRRFEMMSGKKLVMYDRKSRKVEYGYETLMEMAEDG